MDPLLANLKLSQSNNEPRFYPPGMHPATLHIRRQLEKLEEIEERHGATSLELRKHIQRLRNQIAIFEEAESETKALVLHNLLRIEEIRERKKKE